MHSRTRPPESDGLLGAAAGIGRRLASEAIWHRGRCNWIGARLDGDGEGVHEAALDPWLYEGTAGVGWFLAELHSITTDAEGRRTAIGALRCALEAAARSSRAQSGLYVGRAGIAVAAARAGALLGEDELVQGARRVAAGLAQDPRDAAGGVDLLSGSAGTIVALLSLSRQLGERRLVDAAAQAGHELVDAGEEGPGLSWGASDVPARRNLTGLSHGAAGMGFALVELYAATGEPRFARAAERTFDYEMAVFDRREGNWPDFRKPGPRDRLGGRRFMTAWCHGGPGIALSRLAALQRLGGDRWRAEADAGLALARSSLERHRAHGGGNFSLCHGVGGNADILVEGAAVLGGTWTHAREVARAAAHDGAARFGADGPWPCGVGSRQPPGLMLGLAGVGYFLLRVAGVTVPSILRVGSPGGSAGMKEDAVDDQGGDGGHARQL